MATTVDITVTNTAMTGSDVAVTLPSTARSLNPALKLREVIVQPIGGNVSLLGPDGTAFTLQAAQSYPFPCPGWAGKVLTLNGASTASVQMINFFGQMS